jgi:hypothetical protein
VGFAQVCTALSSSAALHVLALALGNNGCALFVRRRRRFVRRTVLEKRRDPAQQYFVLFFHNFFNRFSRHCSAQAATVSVHSSEKPKINCYKINECWENQAMSSTGGAVTIKLVGENSASHVWLVNKTCIAATTDWIQRW